MKNYIILCRSIYTETGLPPSGNGWVCTGKWIIDSADSQAEAMTDFL